LLSSEPLLQATKTIKKTIENLFIVLIIESIREY